MSITGSVGIAGTTYSVFTAQVEQTRGDRVRHLMPNHKVCPKCSKQPIIMRELDRWDKFCPECGTELDTEIGDLYITIDSKYRDPYMGESPLTDKADKDSPTIPTKNNIQETKTVISIRELVILLKEYESQMVIENI